MNVQIAFCGLRCTDCPAFIATASGNEALKQSLANTWSTPEQPIYPEQIHCHGCHALRDEDIIMFGKECAVRKCGLEKNLPNCAHCNEYPCQKLEMPFCLDPATRATLDEERSLFCHGKLA
jgi:hypothetical protein